MKVQVKEISAVEKELEVVVPAEEVVRAFDAAFEKIQKKVQMKGFRPGKIPRSVLEQNYRQDAESEVIQDLVAHTLPEAGEEVGVHPIAPPEIRIVSLGAGTDFVYKAVVEVRPKIEVTGYSDLTLAKDKVGLTDEEVQDNLQALRDRMTTLAPLTESRPSQAGDVVFFDYRGLLGDKEIVGLTAKGYQAELGKGQVLAEIDAGLVGMRPGEKKRIGVTFPPDAADKSVAGKRVELEVVLKELKEKKIPGLNDDFAKDLGSFTTLDEVKVQIREDLARSKEEGAKNGLRKQVIEKLIEKNAFQVPEGMVRAELEEMWRQFEANRRSQGITPEAAGVTREGFFSKNREAALFRVKGLLLCDAIAQREKITVSPEEIDLQIGDMARVSGQPAAVLKKYFQDNDRLSWIEVTVREEKTLDFVLSRSKIKLREGKK